MKECVGFCCVRNESFKGGCAAHRASFCLLPVDYKVNLWNPTSWEQIGPFQGISPVQYQTESIRPTHCEKIRFLASPLSRFEPVVSRSRVQREMKGRSHLAVQNEVRLAATASPTLTNMPRKSCGCRRRRAPLDNGRRFGERPAQGICGLITFPVPCMNRRQQILKR